VARLDPEWGKPQISALTGPNLGDPVHAGGIVRSKPHGGFLSPGRHLR
jgi:hypothetical protein